jgi:hypothetical protein
MLAAAGGRIAANLSALARLEPLRRRPFSPRASRERSETARAISLA